jgi:hypothetical protein
MCSKILDMAAGRGGSLSLRCIRPQRISTGKLTMFAASTPFSIRAGDAGRHEGRNDKNLPRFLQSSAIDPAALRQYKRQTEFHFKRPCLCFSP